VRFLENFMRFSALTRAAAAGALALMPFAPSHAVHVSADGQGQVLLFPYYTVNGGHSTLLSITNHRDRPKALRITFREARHGARVLTFNIYLAANDVWTGAVVVSGDGEEPARIVSSDTTCTVPALPTAGQPFVNFEYAVGDPAAVGPTSLARTREGFIEVIEAGELDNVPGDRPLFAANHANQRNCAALDSAWSFGPWGQNNTEVDPSVAIAPPAGGLSGSAILVDAANGSSFSYRATALQDFFRASSDCAAPCVGVAGENLHALPIPLAPNLASARNLDNGGSSARFHRDGREYVYSFEGEGAGLRAVSAALMQASIGNEYNTRASGNLDARAEWVLTLPTRGLHLGASTASLRQPFNPASTQLEGACETVGLRYWDRENRELAVLTNGTPPPNSNANLPRLCHAAQVWSFNQAGQADGSNAASSILGSRLNHNLVTCAERSVWAPGGCAQGVAQFAEGRAELKADAAHQFLFSGDAPGTANGGDNVLLGLPVLGLWVTSFEATGLPGVLANFTVQQPHAGQRRTTSGVIAQGPEGSRWTEAAGNSAD
jgi:hypothetical protein